jgi:hypothetical protein
MMRRIRAPESWELCPHVNAVMYRKPRLSDECTRARHHECLVVILFKPDSWRCSCACHYPKEAAESLMVDCVDYFIGAVDYALRR